MTEFRGRTRMTVHGEVDLDCSGMLHQALVDCLTATPRGVDLDLAGVTFFDCSGLNALLRARALAQATCAALNVTAVSTAVTRVLDLTHCGEAFLLPAPPAPEADAAPWRAARPA
ncbi:STAS domain-containing protein [Streptomyces sp. NRRL F-5123]|uniref:STAS domain-containing protein n=1 Tax=Streptomyces sp. NRRL F-5123 TaxID=1463856 RepID=UPI00131D9487|nr:STAS domain-containing protein [Streptomyces sp. NRRL F-5123]